MKNYTGMTEDSITDIITWILGSGSSKSPLANCLIHFAAHKGYIPLVKKLLDDGVNVNSKDKSNETPLYLASKSGNVETVRYLIESGANVNFVCTKERITALHMASYVGHTKGTLL